VVQVVVLLWYKIDFKYPTLYHSPT